MKKFNILILAAATLFLTACEKNETTIREAQEVAKKKGAILALNLETSKVNWKAFHKGGFAPRWGILAIKSGEVSIENGEITAGDFTLDMQSIKVDPASVPEEALKYLELEAHLKNADFFEVDKNPTAGFKVTKVTALAPDDKGSLIGANKTVSGNLTLKGKTLNISFPAKVAIVEGSLTLLAKFTVNRTDWNINFATSEADPAEWIISKDLEIGIDVQTVKI